jgi:hypothetical protein
MLSWTIQISPFPSDANCRFFLQHPTTELWACACILLVGLKSRTTLRSSCPYFRGGACLGAKKCPSTNSWGSCMFARPTEGGVVGPDSQSANRGPSSRAASAAGEAQTQLNGAPSFSHATRVLGALVDWPIATRFSFPERRIRRKTSSFAFLAPAGSRRRFRRRSGCSLRTVTT